MPPRCHQSKKEAVFQLCNFLCSQSVSQITDLANGEILYNTIQERFPPFPGANIDSSDVLRYNTESKGVKNENSENESNLATKDKDIFLQHIEKFIDDHYNIKSETIITYEKCKNLDEFEIVKVAMFVLSEIIKLVLETKSEDLETLFHIDLKFQFELESIFKLFITERQSLNKEEVEKLLTRKSKNVSPFTTPRRTSTRHREQLLEYGTPKEDIHSNSPLKSYFESPIFKKQAVRMDEKMQYYEKTLEEGEEQATNMENKITKLENDLKDKEKSIKCLLNKLEEKEEENQNILRDIESLKAQQERTSKELAKKKNDCELFEIRVTELNSQIDDLSKTVLEKTSSVKRRRSSYQLCEKSFLQSKEEQIALLKDKVKNLEIKNYSYKKELAEKILTELDRKKSPGARNQSYEEIWQTEDIERRKREELLSTIIDADNKDLSAKLNSAQVENQRLLKEIENLKKKLSGKNRKSGTTELKDTSQISETEQFRKSFNETSFILNNSDYLIPCEQSVISSEPETLPCSQKSSEAVLWKMYDSQKLETENTCDINLNHDSVIPENSKLDVINDFQLSNIKIEIIEPGSSNQDDNYVLGNLNFNDFFNELKKLTKNGSFQKVLQVFGKRQKEMDGTNGCKRLDLQEMLKIITDIICLIATLNTESSVCDQADKCCSTDVKELSTVIELNIEINKLKNQLSIVSQKQENDLKIWKNELEELMQEKIKLENKYQTSAQGTSENKQAFEGLYQKYRDTLTKTENLNRKYCILRKTYEQLLDTNKQSQAEYSNLRKFYSNINRRKQYYEKQHKVSQEENSKLKAILTKIKEENEKLLKEKKAWKVGSDSYIRDVSVPNYLGIKSDAYQDTANESVLSGAFHKNISHYVSENEDDFCYYNSLNPINKEDDRVEEIKRRNSLYPRQLQSSYPLEVDLNATYHSLYVQDKCREQRSKKLKLGDVITEETSLFETPISKPKKKLETPSSFKKLMNKVKCKRITTKPRKPS